MQTKRKICAWLVSIFLLTWACSLQAAQKPKDADCLACHSDTTLTKDVNGKKVSLLRRSGCDEGIDPRRDVQLRGLP